MNDMLGGILTYKLAGEDLVRDCGVPFAVVRPTALTEEPEGMPVKLEQGDTIRVRLSAPTALLPLPRPALDLCACVTHNLSVLYFPRISSRRTSAPRLVAEMWLRSHS